MHPVTDWLNSIRAKFRCDQTLSHLEDANSLERFNHREYILRCWGNILWCWARYLMIETPYDRDTLWSRHLMIETPYDRDMEDRSVEDCLLFPWRGAYCYALFFCKVSFGNAPLKNLFIFFDSFKIRRSCEYLDSIQAMVAFGCSYISGICKTSKIWKYHKN